MASRRKDPWVLVETALPPEGKYVLIHLTNNNWKDSSDPEGVYFKVAKMVKGISKTERVAMLAGDLPDPEVQSMSWNGETWELVAHRRSAITTGEDEAGNNLRPYRWEEFGPGKRFGQEVDRWMHIPERVS
jgi:hypothetical protein